MDTILSHVFEVVATLSRQDASSRAIACLVASIVLYAVFINLDRDRPHARRSRPLRCPDSILRG